MSDILNLDKLDGEYQQTAIATPESLEKALDFYRYQYNALNGTMSTVSFGASAATLLSAVNIFVPYPASIASNMVAIMIAKASTSEAIKFKKYTKQAYEALEIYAGYFRDKQRSNPAVVKFEIAQALRPFTSENGITVSVFRRCVITGYIDKYGNKVTS